MKEQDIRPQKLEKKCNELRLEDIKNFFGDQKKFKKVNCPACDSNNYQPEFKKGIFSFCRCKKCVTLFVNPRPSQQQLADFYSKSKSIAFWSEYIFPRSEKARIKNIFIPRVKLIASILRKYNGLPARNLLEVGAGDGFFLKSARDFKIANKLLAVEPSRKAAHKCRELGFKVFENMIEDVVLKEKVDIIVNFELIEHLFNPLAFVKSCCNILKNKGLFIITTPNIKGFDLALLGSLSDNITGPNHINYFHPDSIKILLEKSDLEIVEVSTPGKLDVDIIKNKMLAGVVKPGILLPFGELILEDKDGFNNRLQNFLVENQLSSNMMIIAQKK